MQLDPPQERLTHGKAMVYLNSSVNGQRLADRLLRSRRQMRPETTTGTPGGRKGKPCPCQPSCVVILDEVGSAMDLLVKTGTYSASTEVLR